MKTKHYLVKYKVSTGGIELTDFMVSNTRDYRRLQSKATMEGHFWPDGKWDKEAERWEWDCGGIVVQLEGVDEITAEQAAFCKQFYIG